MARLLVLGGSWFLGRATADAARALEPVASRYVIVSSVSAYQGWPLEPLTEDSATLVCEPDSGPDPGYDGDSGPTTYGFGKAGCERAVLQVFGLDRSVILRPGVILGPGEYIGRTAWWLNRLRRGGTVLAPRSPGPHRSAGRHARRGRARAALAPGGHPAGVGAL